MNFILRMWCYVLVLSLFPSFTEEIPKTEDCLLHCPAGYFKVETCANNKNKCKKCETGSFTKYKNTLEECLRCTDCPRHSFVLKNCSYDIDTICKCEDGYFPHEPGDKNLLCIDCNSQKQKPCKNEDCKQGTMLHASQMKACECKGKCLTTRNTPLNVTPTITTVMKKSTNNTIPKIDAIDEDYRWAIPVFMVILVIVLLLVSLLLFTMTEVGRSCCFPRKILVSPVEPHLNEQSCDQCCSQTSVSVCEEPSGTLLQSPNAAKYPTQLIPLLLSPEHNAPRLERQSERWHATVLYAIINEVPVRRWKEFVRLLSVGDQQLERIELEPGLSSLEKQYQMLKLWSHGPSAAMEDVYSALYYMDLAGCAQLLQESLDQLQWKTCRKASYCSGVTQPPIVTATAQDMLGL